MSLTVIATGFQMSQMDKSQIALDREDYFFRDVKDTVRNNSLKNFTRYWQLKNRPIALQKLLIAFFMNRYI